MQHMKGRTMNVGEMVVPTYQRIASHPMSHRLSHANFKGAAKMLKQLSTKILSSAEAQWVLFNKGIRWNFIVEEAPRWGGGGGMVLRG